MLPLARWLTLTRPSDHASSLHGHDFALAPVVLCYATPMVTDESEVWVQLATRIPKTLHRTLKLHCVESDTSVMAFVVGALQDKIAREATRGRRATPARRRKL